jgi:hypothetical protein
MLSHLGTQGKTSPDAGRGTVSPEPDFSVPGKGVWSPGCFKDNWETFLSLDFFFSDTGV